MRKGTTAARKRLRDPDKKKYGRVMANIAPAINRQALLRWKNTRTPRNAVTALKRYAAEEIRNPLAPVSTAPRPHIVAPARESIGNAAPTTSPPIRKIPNAKSP